MVDKMTHIRLTHSAIVKSPGLLPMLYTVAELAEAINIPDRTLRDWLAAGAPSQRDSSGRIWVNGRRFAEWIASMQKPIKGRKTKEQEGYCMRCNQVVQIIDPHTKKILGQQGLIQGQCPNCKGKVNRGCRLPIESNTSTVSKE